MNKPAFDQARRVARVIKNAGATRKRIAAWCKYMRAALADTPCK